MLSLLYILDHYFSANIRNKQKLAMLTNSFEAGEHGNAKYQHLTEMVAKDINAALKILQGKFKK